VTAVSFRVAILTMSDSGAAGEQDDASGQAIREMLEAAGYEIAKQEMLPDERAEIVKTLRAWASGGEVGLIVTTGGTGLSPRDVTPEAMKEVIDYEVPGMAEAMRAEGLKHTPMSMISRAMVGVLGRTLVINLPGSPKAVRQNLAVVLPVLGHALELLAGRPSEHNN
jgi:molybdenum cofactor synthesis domain-containing protein